MPVEELPLEERELVESYRHDLGQQSAQVLSSANVELRAVYRPRPKALEEKLVAKQTEKMQGQSQSLEKVDSLSSLEVREAEINEVGEETGVVMEYNESKRHGQRLIGAVEVSDAAPALLELPDAGFGRAVQSPLLRSSESSRPISEPSLGRAGAGDGLLSAGKEVLGAPIAMDGEREEVLDDAVELNEEREVIAKAMSRQQTTFQPQKFESEKLEDRTLERGVRRSPIIREGARGKVFRSTLPSRMSPIKRSSPLSKDTPVAR
jgi:hypothetical protein